MAGGAPGGDGESRAEAGWAEVALLAEPTRRRVYDAVRVARAPLTRDEVAVRTGVTRRLATFHLDQLAAAGLLEVDFARPAGRGGPGAGRPAKRYTAVARDVAVSLPGRRYDLVARILAAAVRDADGRTPREAAHAAADREGRVVGERWSTGRRRRAGRTLSPGRTLAVAGAALEALGYEPLRDGRVVRLTNCPFDAAVEVAPDVVCGVNERFVAGVLAGIGGAPCVVARLLPDDSDCCVRLETEPAGD